MTTASLDDDRQLPLSREGVLVIIRKRPAVSKDDPAKVTVTWSRTRSRRDDAIDKTTGGGNLRSRRLKGMPIKKKKKKASVIGEDIGADKEQQYVTVKTRVS